MGGSYMQSKYILTVEFRSLGIVLLQKHWMVAAEFVVY